MSSTSYATLPMELKEKIAYHVIHSAYQDAQEPFCQETPIMHDHLRNTSNSLASYAHQPFLHELTCLRAALDSIGSPATEMVRGLKMLTDEVKEDIDYMEKARLASDWNLACKWHKRLRWRPSWIQKMKLQWCALREHELNFLWRVKVIADLFLQDPPHKQLVKHAEEGATHAAGGRNTGRSSPPYPVSTLSLASTLRDMSQGYRIDYPSGTAIPVSVRVYIFAMQHAGEIR